MNAQHIGMFFFCFFKTIGKIIVISPVGINKTGRNIDDDSLIGQRIVHLYAVDIIGHPGKSDQRCLPPYGYPRDLISSTTIRTDFPLVSIFIVFSA